MTGRASGRRRARWRFVLRLGAIILLLACGWDLSETGKRTTAAFPRMEVLHTHQQTRAKQVHKSESIRPAHRHWGLLHFSK